MRTSSVIWGDFKDWRVRPSGMWGMNFARIPLADHPLGFWILLGGQLAIGALLLAALRLLRLL